MIYLLLNNIVIILQYTKNIHLKNLYNIMTSENSRFYNYFYNLNIENVLKIVFSNYVKINTFLKKKHQGFLGISS